MTYQQLVTPNPDIPCWPGMCLQYVRQAFDAPLVEPTATEGWNRAKYRHTDYNFPSGVWIPLWFAIPGIPAGHVALMAPDGSVYSTSDNSNTPHHHPSLDHLIWYYGPRVEPQYQLELQYLGWSEDISRVRVVQEFNISAESTTTTQEDDMPSAQEIAQAVWGYNNGTDRDAWQILRDIPGDTLTKQFPHKDPITGKDDGQTTSLATVGGFFDYQAVQTRLANASAQQIVSVIPDALVQGVAQLLAARLEGK